MNLLSENSYFLLIPVDFLNIFQLLKISLRKDLSNSRFYRNFKFLKPSFLTLALGGGFKKKNTHYIYSMNNWRGFSSKVSLLDVYLFIPSTDQDKTMFFRIKLHFYSHLFTNPVKINTNAINASKQKSSILNILWNYYG